MATPQKPSLRAKRIFVAEDEMLVALDIETAFGAAGAILLGPVGHLDEGLRSLEGLEEIDAAVLDVDLHGDEVFPLAKILAERHVPFLFHTGRSDLSAITQLFPGVKICAKPGKVEDLVTEVGRLVH
ncbi:hypothetical protein ATO5_12940 [Loktanella sp. 22II-4b]|nr:hypothetical protein ATO5_12940 [Loktanella sp. 22II-4b]